MPILKNAKGVQAKQLPATILQPMYSSGRTACKRPPVLEVSHWEIILPEQTRRCFFFSVHISFWALLVGEQANIALHACYDLMQEGFLMLARQADRISLAAWKDSTKTPRQTPEILVYGMLHCVTRRARSFQTIFTFRQDVRNIHKVRLAENCAGVFLPGNCLFPVVVCHTFSRSSPASG